MHICYKNILLLSWNLYVQITERIVNIGLKIKQIRKEKNLKQIDLASLCNLEQSSIARIESGRTNPTISNLYKIADALEIDIKDLL